MCHVWPISQLEPGDIVVAVRLHGMPGSQPPPGGDQITVAGMPARRISGPADDAFDAIVASAIIAEDEDVTAAATGRSEHRGMTSRRREPAP